MMDRAAPGVMQMKMLDAILGPGTKSSMCVSLDLRTAREVAIAVAITFPVKAEGKVAVHLLTSVDDKVYDDQDFLLFYIPSPDWNSLTMPPEELLKPVIVERTATIRPVMNYLRAVVENVSVDKAVIAKVAGLWLPGK